jgi:tetratricopeptide (TPR) repeat protein
MSERSLQSAAVLPKYCDQLKDLESERNLKHDFFAKLLGIKGRTLSKIFARDSVSRDTLTKVAKWLNRQRGANGDLIFQGTWRTLCGCEEHSDEKLEPTESALPRSLSRFLVGRDEELSRLNDSWRKAAISVACVVAVGGTGKTQLIKHWLSRIERQPDRPERIIVYSFYDQGVSESRGITDNSISDREFFVRAIEQLDPSYNSTGESDYQLAKRLLGLVNRQTTLLILDGLEPLLTWLGDGSGYLKDTAPSLKKFLVDLATCHTAIKRCHCVITTRVRVRDLENTADLTKVDLIPLEDLPPHAGAELLRKLGVNGELKELEVASTKFHGHCLTLTLLGTAISSKCEDRDIRHAEEVNILSSDQDHRDRARKVLDWYVRKLTHEQVQFMRLLGLFNRPADRPALEAVLSARIPYLTDDLGALHDPSMVEAIVRLRQARLLPERDTSKSESLDIDTHPLIREYFSDLLQQQAPKSWTDGHMCLYDHMRTPTSELRDEWPCLLRLYIAVWHACKAGLYMPEMYMRAWNEVFWPGILKEEQYWSGRKFGAFANDLAALSGFFEPGSSKLVPGLSTHAEGHILFLKSQRLGTLGRLREAIPLMEDALHPNRTPTETAEDCRVAAFRRRVFSELLLFSGKLKAALKNINLAVELADRSSDKKERLMERSLRGAVHHQMGNLSAAQADFEEAEAIEKQRQPDRKYLTSIWGYYYCDLLLTQMRWVEVKDRAQWALDNQPDIKHGQGKIDVALDFLSLGRACVFLAKAKNQNPTAKEIDYYNKALAGLRDAARRQHLPRGLLARHDLFEFVEDGDIETSLEDALSIALRDNMDLFALDCYLAKAQLYSKRDRVADARLSWIGAQALIRQNPNLEDYKRREEEVKQLESQFALDIDSNLE